MNIIKIIAVILALLFVTWLAIFVGQKINTRLKQNPSFNITNLKPSPIPTTVPLPSITFPSPVPTSAMTLSPITPKTSPTPAISKGGLTPVTGPEMLIPLFAIVSSAAAGLYFLKK